MVLASDMVTASAPCRTVRVCRGVAEMTTQNPFTLSFPWACEIPREMPRGENAYRVHELIAAQDISPHVSTHDGYFKGLHTSCLLGASKRALGRSLLKGNVEKAGLLPLSQSAVDSLKSAQYDLHKTSRGSHWELSQVKVRYHAKASKRQGLSEGSKIVMANKPSRGYPAYCGKLTPASNQWVIWYGSIHQLHWCIFWD